VLSSDPGSHLQSAQYGPATAPDPIPPDVAEALHRLGGTTGSFAETIRWYTEVGSTNDVAATLAESGASEGTVVAADAQTAGRGRLGRQWASPRGAGLYVSIVLRPRPDRAALLTIGAGVAVCEAVRAATGVTPDLKWPNDALIGDRKVAGILAEAGTASGAVHHVVLGIGINIRPAAYSVDVAPLATSLEAELGKAVDRGLVFAELLTAVRRRYVELQQGETARVIEAWRRLATATLRRAVEWEASGRVQRGIARDIDATGALLVDTSSGPARVIAGAVRWL